MSQNVQQFCKISKKKKVQGMPNLSIWQTHPTVPAQIHACIGNNTPTNLLPHIQLHYPHHANGKRPSDKTHRAGCAARIEAVPTLRVLRILKGGVGKMRRWFGTFIGRSHWPCWCSVGLHANCNFSQSFLALGRTQINLLTPLLLWSSVREYGSLRLTRRRKFRLEVAGS